MKHILLNGTLIWEALQEEAESEFDALWEVLKSPTVQGYITQDDLDTLYCRIATEQDFERAFAMVSYVQQVLRIYYPGHSHTLDVAIAQNRQPEFSHVKLSSNVPFVSVKGFLERHSLNQLLEESVPTIYAKGWQRKGQQSDFDPLLLVPIALTLLLQNTPLFQTLLNDDLNETKGNDAYDPNHLFEHSDGTTIYDSVIQSSRNAWHDSTAQPLLVKQIAQLQDVDASGDVVELAGDRPSVFPSLISPHAFTLAWYQLNLNSSVSQVVTQQRARLHSDSLFSELALAGVSTTLPNRSNFAVRLLSAPTPLSIVRSGENYSIPLPPQHFDRPESEATSGNRRDRDNLSKPSIGQPFFVIISPRPRPSGETSADPPVQGGVPTLEDSPEDLSVIPNKMRLVPEEVEAIPADFYAVPEAVYVTPEDFYGEEDANLPFLDSFLEIILADISDSGLYIGIVMYIGIAIWTPDPSASQSGVTDHNSNIVSSNDPNLENTDVPVVIDSDADLLMINHESASESMTDPNQDTLLHGGRWYGVMPQPLSQSSIDGANDVIYIFDELLQGGQHGIEPAQPSITTASDLIHTSDGAHHMVDTDLGTMFSHGVTAIELNGAYLSNAYSDNTIDFPDNHRHSTDTLHHLL